MPALLKLARLKTTFDLCTSATKSEVFQKFIFTKIELSLLPSTFNSIIIRKVLRQKLPLLPNLKLCTPAFLNCLENQFCEGT